MAVLRSEAPILQEAVVVAQFQALGQVSHWGHVASLRGSIEMLMGVVYVY